MNRWVNTGSIAGESIQVRGADDRVPIQIEQTDNKVWFYGDIYTESCLDLIRRLTELDNSLRTQTVSRTVDPDLAPIATPIWLFINSPGGDLLTANAVSDHIKLLQSPVHSVVEGITGSAATIISMSCDVRYMRESAFMLIHQLSTVAWGTFDQIKDEVLFMEMAMNQLKTFYAEQSHLSPEQVEEFLKRDSWFDSNQALKAGLVDKII
jgi:ATP-dependent protease ClpP protease subunit